MEAGSGLESLIVGQHNEDTSAWSPINETTFARFFSLPSHLLHGHSVPPILLGSTLVMNGHPRFTRTNARRDVCLSVERGAEYKLKHLICQLTVPLLAK